MTQTMVVDLVVVWPLRNQIWMMAVDLVDPALGCSSLEGVVQITIWRPLQMHSTTSPLKRWARLMPQESRNQEPLTVVTGSEVWFMDHIFVLHKIIVSFLGQTSKIQPTNILVVKSPFAVGFVLSGAQKAAEIGVFIARNPIQHLQICGTIAISPVAVVTSFIVR